MAEGEASGRAALATEGVFRCPHCHQRYAVAGPEDIKKIREHLKKTTVGDKDSRWIRRRLKEK